PLRPGGLQTAFRPRPRPLLRPARPWPVLPRLRGADGPFRRGAARAHPSGHLRRPRRAYRARSAAPPGLLRAGLRGRLPEVLRERPGGADRQLGAGPPADLPRRSGAVAPVRAVARAVARGAGPGAGRLAGRSAAYRGASREASRLISGGGRRGRVKLMGMVMRASSGCPSRMAGSIL